MTNTNPTKPIRYEYLDILRGVTLLSMILYHILWDLVYIADVSIGWFRTDGAYIWQQSICITFILLAGFCWSLGRQRLRRGLLVFGAGLLVTAVTVIFTPGQRVIFGVLTLLGSCMLLLIPLEKLLRKVPSVLGLCLAMGLFVLTRNVNLGYLGIGGNPLLTLPKEWYDGGWLMTYLGFMEKGFFSTDYFSLMPWMFLFLAGYFLYGLVREQKQLENPWLLKLHCRPLGFVGRHSLLIYLIHQPVIYALVTCCVQ